MRLLIDGYNFLNCAGIVADADRAYSLEASRIAVVRFLRSVLSDCECQRTTVVFDGRESPPGLPKQIKILGVDVRFSKRGEEADDLLEELIRQHNAPRQLTVVSSDHRVQRAAKRRRAKAINSELWFAQSRATYRNPRPADEKPPESPEASELEGWIERFAEPKHDQDMPHSAALPSPNTDPASTDIVFPAEYLEALQDDVDRDATKQRKADGETRSSGDDRPA